MERPAGMRAYYVAVGSADAKLVGGIAGGGW